jgi:hypothetical protein
MEPVLPALAFGRGSGFAYDYAGTSKPRPYEEGLEL